MATNAWEVRDVFTYSGGTGVVIGDNLAVLVTGNNRTRWNLSRGPIPEDAQIVPIEGVRSEVSMALRGALAAIGL